MTQSPSTPPHPDPARYVARALTPEAFAPYGDVLRPGLGETKDIRGGTVRLSKSPAVFEHLPAAPDAKLDFYDVQPLHGRWWPAPSNAIPDRPSCSVRWAEHVGWWRSGPMAPVGRPKPSWLAPAMWSPIARTSGTMGSWRWSSRFALPL